MTKRLKYIYAFSLLPLLIGTLLFMYWFYARVYFAKDVRIEIAAFFTIIAYLVLAIVAFILCIRVVIKDRHDWKKIIIPLVALLLTIPAIEIYSMAYNALSEKAFIRLVNDNRHYNVGKVWSSHFDQPFFEPSDEEVFSFYPVYNYEGVSPFNSFDYSLPYKIDSVHIYLISSENSILLCHFPPLSKGDCETIYVSDLIKNSVSKH